MKHFFKSVGCKILGGVALILVGLMIYAASTGGISTFVASAAGVIVTPLQSAVTAVSDAVSGFFGGAGSSELQKQVEELQNENRELRQRVADYDEIKLQNEWYNQILSLHEEHPDYTFADGKVITMDPSDPFCSFSINCLYSGTTALASKIGLLMDNYLLYTR